MGKISHFDQQRLASSVVGVANIQPGAVQTGVALSRLANTTQQQIEMTARANNEQYRRELAKQEALREAQQKMLDDVEVANHEAQLAMMDDDIRNALKEQNIESPTNVPKMYQGEAAKQMDEYYKSIPSETVRNKVRIAGARRIKSGTDALSDWALTQRTNNTKGQLSNTLHQLEQKAGEAKDVGSLTQLIETAKGLRPSALISYGAEADEKLRKHTTSMVQNYITKRMIDNHAEVRPLIESGAFDDYLSPKQRKDLIKEAGLLEKAEAQQERFDRRMEAMGNRIVSATEVSTIDMDDIQDIQTGIATIQTRLETEQSKPLEQQDLEYTSQLLRDKARLEKSRKNFKTEQAEQEKKKAQTSYDSDTGVKAREMMYQLKTMMQGKKERGEYTNAESFLREAERYETTVRKLYGANYLQAGEQQRELNWVNGLREKVGNKSDKRSLLEKLNSSEDRIRTQDKQFLQTVPALNNTPERTRDSLNRRYDELMDEAITKYKTKYKRDPGEAELKRLSGHIRQILGSEYGSGRH